MMEFLILLGGFVLVGAGAVAYFRNRDPLHPLVYLGPMMFYLYVLLPAYHFYTGALEEAYPEMATLEIAHGVIVLSMAAFCVGCLWYKLPGRVGDYAARPLEMSFSVVQRLLFLSMFLGLLGIAAYLYQISNVGGFARAYGTAKGGGWAPSGYISDAPLLTIPAMMMYALSRMGKPLDLKTALWMVTLVSPHLIQGFLGARRGPAFFALAALFFGWYLATAKRPTLRVTLLWISALGVLMIFLVSQRGSIKLGYDWEVDQDKFSESLISKEVGKNETTAMAWSVIQTARYHKRCYWGMRYMVQVLVRPIPRQLWPNKYEDLGMQWMVEGPGSAGFTWQEWEDAVGYSPESGVACGFAADAFLELSWGGLVICFLVGLLYSYLWRQALVFRGVWSVLYFEASVMSVYIPSQGLASAWMYRFLFLAIPTVVLWSMMGKLQKHFSGTQEVGEEEG